MKPSVQLIDCNYLQPQFEGAYLMTEGSRAAFIENNTAHAVPLLLRALEDRQIKPSQVDYLIITHVHLDHAGGSSRLMNACPSAVLLAHPRAVPHLIDPSRLVASAKKVYGEKRFADLYGAIEAIPAERVRAVEDGETLRWAGRDLHFFHTRGHANHHFCVYDPASRGVFTGDSFGLAYPGMQKRGLFIFPSTSPTDFNAAEAIASVKKIRDCGADRAYLTHFGKIDDLPEAARQLETHLGFCADLLERAQNSGLPHEEWRRYCLNEFEVYFKTLCRKTGWIDYREISDLMKLDLEVNAMGIAYAAQKSLAK